MAQESGNNRDHCRLQAPERNRYFFGKLLTVRDFEVEQTYFRRAVGDMQRLVHGTGVVCGLEVSGAEIHDQELRVRVSEGQACDCCGNRIMVPREGSYAVQGDLRSGQTAYLYLRLEEYGRETSPPLPNSCQEGDPCVYSRVRESFNLELSYDDPPPDPPTPFSRGDLDLSSAQDLQRWVAKYAAEHLSDCPECRDPRVFLAVIQFSSSGRPEVDEKSTRAGRHYLSSNPLLRDLLFGHIADRQNPHGVTAAQSGALTEINGVSNPGGGVELRSSDNSIRIDASDSANAINLRARRQGPNGGMGGVLWGETFMEFKNGRSRPQVVKVPQLERGQQFSVILASRLAPAGDPPKPREAQGNFFVYGDQEKRDGVLNQDNHALIAYVPVFPSPEKRGVLEPNGQFVISGHTDHRPLKNSRMRVFFWVITGDKIESQDIRVEDYEEARARWEKERQKAFAPQGRSGGQRDPDLEDRIIELLKENPVTPPKTIADSLQADKEAVQASLDALEADGLVVKNAQGRFSMAD